MLPPMPSPIAVEASSHDVPGDVAAAVGAGCQMLGCA